MLPGAERAVRRRMLSDRWALLRWRRMLSQLEVLLSGRGLLFYRFPVLPDRRMLQGRRHLLLPGKCQSALLLPTGGKVHADRDTVLQ